MLTLPTMKSINKTLKAYLLICFLAISSLTFGHSVQVAYCVNCNGDLRVYVEHWHGSEAITSTTMDLNLTVGGVVTSISGIPSGGIYGVPFSGLPGCATPAVVFGSCPGSANTYNDWIYYDFFGVPAGVPITITVISGSTAFTMDGCGMYPTTTAPFTIPTSVAPSFANQTVCGGSNFLATLFSDPTKTTWTNSNPAIGLAASGSGNIGAFTANTTTVTQTAVITVSTQCYVTTFTLTVNPAPNPNFTFPAPVGGKFCKGTTIPFSLVNSFNIASTNWSFGDGGTSSLPGPSHTYTANGIYTVQLNITPSVGTCTALSTQTISIYTPTANFSVVNSCLNTSSTFTNSSTSPAVFAAQVYNYGDGTPNGTSAAHTYSAVGTYTVKLVVIDANLCKDSINKVIVISPNPIIAFTSNTVCLGSSTSFTNTSSVSLPSSITTWAWDFDNNGTIDNSTQNPTNLYVASGTYSVELKAISNNGCKDSLTVPIIVHANPTATFTPVNACEGASIALNNTSSILAPDNISLYAWSFGSGGLPFSTSSNSNPIGLNYLTSGVKTITLIITANTSCTATITQTVTVHPTPVSSFSATSVCQSTATAFTDLSTTSTGTINAWSWDYTNDGAPDNTTQNPTFTFPSSGTFTAALTVTSSNLCVNTSTLLVNVWGHTIPNFSPDNVCFGAATTFTNFTNITTNPNVGSAPSYIWDFADGTTTVTATNPAHTYTLGGNVNAVYNVTLTSTSSHGCTDIISKNVNVYSIPTASFTSDSVCFGSPTHLTDLSNGNGNTVNGYSWDFSSNGSVDVTGISNPNYTFPTPGSNLVTYTSSTTPTVGLTCYNTTNTITVWVNPLPNSNFTFVNKCINAQPNTFDASSSTISVGTNTAYAWSYADAGTGTGITPTHNYALAGIYNVTLTVTSNKGCQGKIVKPVEVYQKPIMSISNSNSCFTKVMTFTANTLPGSGIVNNWFWDIDNTVSSIELSGQTNNFTFPAAGNQTITLVTETTNGCRDTLSKVVYVDYVPVPLFSVNKPNGCPTHCVSFTDLTLPITGPGVNADWKWIFGDGTELHASSGVAQAHCYENSTSNQLNLFDIKLVVTTNKGCTDSLQKNGFITVYPTPIASYTVNPNPGSVVTPFETFTNESIDYTKWWWSFGDGPQIDSVNNNPTHFYNSENANTYSSILMVQNQYGCRDTAYVKVEIQPDFSFYIPNAFSPGNEDGVNDIFTGMGIGIAKYEMWIYDRWGASIFYTDDIKKGWDGKVQGKLKEVQQDVYVWKVKLIDVLDKKHAYVGHVTIVK
jgi:gliding motility-associated-like protein